MPIRFADTPACQKNPKAAHRRCQYTVIDLFAGCGGLSLGLYQAGWKGLFAIEKNPNAFETLKHNLIDKKNHFSWPKWLECSPHDIDEVIKQHEEELKALRGQVDLVAGGPPCQGFSMAGERKEEDMRNKLVFSYVNFISLVEPQLLLFENVKGFTSAFRKDNPEAIPYSQIVKERLEELGYGITSQVIDFSKFGVPQRRRRFILVGIRGATNEEAEQFFSLVSHDSPTFLNSVGLSPSCTVEEALSDLLKSNGTYPTPDRKGFESAHYGKISSPYQTYLRKECGLDEPQSHSFAKHSIEKAAIFKNLLDNYPVRNQRIDGNARAAWGIRQRGITILDPHTTSPTITGLPDDYLHYCEPRIMTVRECARLQSFPDWYEFQSKYTTGGKLRKKEVPRYSQVGNAIPPLFAQQAGLVLKKMLKQWTN